MLIKRKYQEIIWALRSSLPEKIDTLSMVKHIIIQI